MKINHSISSIETICHVQCVPPGFWFGCGKSMYIHVSQANFIKCNNKRKCEMFSFRIWFMFVARTVNKLLRFRTVLCILYAIGCMGIEAYMLWIWRHNYGFKMFETYCCSFLHIPVPVNPATFNFHLMFAYLDKWNGTAFIPAIILSRQNRPATVNNHFSTSLLLTSHSDLNPRTLPFYKNRTGFFYSSRF